MEAALQNTNVKSVIPWHSPQRATGHTRALAQSSPPKYPEKKQLHSKLKHTLLRVLTTFAKSTFSVSTTSNFVENSQKG